MDPITVALTSLGAKEVLEGVKSAAKYWRARGSGLEAAEAELQESYELAIRLWGSLLFECRANIERLRLMHEGARQTPPFLYFAPFDFGVSDALLADFCRVVPTPAILEACRLMIAAVKRVDFFQRAAGTAQYEKDAAELRGKALGFVTDAMDKGIVTRFNGLVAKAQEVATKVFPADPDCAALIGRMLPEKIDPDGAVNHGLL